MAKGALIRKVIPRFTAWGPIVSAAFAIIKAAQETPAVREGIASVSSKAKSAWESRSAYGRLSQKLDAVEQCAQLVESGFPEADVSGWRSASLGLRTRAELLRHGHVGRNRNRALKKLLAEAEALLEKVNQELVRLTEQAAGKAPEIP